MPPKWYGDVQMLNILLLFSPGLLKVVWHSRALSVTQWPLWVHCLPVGSPSPTMTKDHRGSSLHNITLSHCVLSCYQPKAKVLAEACSLWRSCYRSPSWFWQFPGWWTLNSTTTCHSQFVSESTAPVFRGTIHVELGAHPAPVGLYPNITLFLNKAIFWGTWG